MRALNPAAQALLDRALAGERIPFAQLLRVDLAPVAYYTTAGRVVQWGGQVWQPVGLQLEALAHHAGGEVAQLQITLPGVSPEQLAAALGPSVDGTTVAVFEGPVDPATGTMPDAVLAWAGQLCQPSIDDGAQATVGWVAEHRALHALRVKPSRYTHDEQQRLYPGDTALNVDPATDAAPLVWPAASFFRQ